MPHYFFNILDDNGFVPDTEGTEFPDDDAARREGELSAREILANDVLWGREIDNRRLEVRDRRGQLIICVVLKDLVC